MTTPYSGARRRPRGRLAGLLLAAAVGVTASGQALAAGTLRMAMSDDPPHLDVHTTTAGLTSIVGLHVLETLYTFNAGLHANGLEEVLPHFEMLPIDDYCARSGVPEDRVRKAARRIATAESVAFYEDLGVQMNRHSTLVSYLHRLLAYGTGNFGKAGHRLSRSPRCSRSSARRRSRARTTGRR